MRACFHYTCAVAAAAVVVGALLLNARVPLINIRSTTAEAIAEAPEQHMCKQNSTACNRRAARSSVVTTFGTELSVLQSSYSALRTFTPTSHHRRRRCCRRRHTSSIFAPMASPTTTTGSNSENISRGGGPQTQTHTKTRDTRSFRGCVFDCETRGVERQTERKSETLNLSACLALR